MIAPARRWTRLRPWTRHSTVLLVAGLVYIFIGLSYTLAGEGDARKTALAVALSWMPLNVWGYIFMGAGLLSVVSTRWPEFMETWGYMVLTGLSASWAAFYGTGVIFLEAPSTGWTGTFLWGLVAFLWWAISGLLNPGRLPAVSNGPD